MRLSNERNQKAGEKSWGGTGKVPPVTQWADSPGKPVIPLSHTNAVGRTWLTALVCSLCRLPCCKHCPPGWYGATAAIYRTQRWNPELSGGGQPLTVLQYCCHSDSIDKNNLQGTVKCSETVTKGSICVLLLFLTQFKCKFI